MTILLTPGKVALEEQASVQSRNLLLCPAEYEGDDLVEAKPNFVLEKARGCTAHLLHDASNGFVRRTDYLVIQVAEKACAISVPSDIGCKPYQ